MATKTQEPTLISKTEETEAVAELTAEQKKTLEKKSVAIGISAGLIAVMIIIAAIPISMLTPAYLTRKVNQGRRTSVIIMLCVLCVWIFINIFLIKSEGPGEFQGWFWQKFMPVLMKLVHIYMLLSIVPGLFYIFKPSDKAPKIAFWSLKTALWVFVCVYAVYFLYNARWLFIYYQTLKPTESE